MGSTGRGIPGGLHAMIMVNLLHQDLKLRNFIKDRLAQAGVSKIVVERPAKKARVTIHTARPGIVIGKKGADIEKL